VLQRAAMQGPFNFHGSTCLYIALALGLIGCGKNDNAGRTEGAATNSASITVALPAPSAASTASTASSPLNAPKDGLSQGQTSASATPTANWAAAKEVLIRGSSAVSCETKVMGASFRMVCRPNEKTGKVVSAKPVRGFDATKGSITVQADELTLTYPYERGTDVVVTILWERSFGRFMLHWPPGKTELPQVPGQIVVQELGAAAPQAVKIDEPPPETKQKDRLFVIYDERRRYGYIDASGNVVIPTEFEDTTRFEEGFAAVRQNKRWGYADRTGKVVIAPQWASAGVFSEGYAQVTLNERIVDSSTEAIETGYIDRSGKYVIQPVWRGGAEDFHSGLALVFPEKGVDQRGGSGIRAPSYIKPDGSVAFSQHRFFHARSFSESLAFATISPADTLAQRSAFIDPEGKELALPQGYSIRHDFADGVAVVGNWDMETWALFDKSGKLITIKDAEEIDEFSEGLAVVTVRGRDGYMKPDGTWAIKPKYACARRFSDGVARVCEGSVTDERYINAAGRVVILGGRGMPAFIPWGRVAGDYEGGLQYRKLTGTMTSTWPVESDDREKPDPKASYGYRNKAGKYVWVSPGAEAFLPEQFWKDEYVGPARKPTTAPAGSSATR
jgi:WG containing repeat